MKPHGTYDTAFQAGAASRDEEIAALQVKVAEAESSERLAHAMFANRVVECDKLRKDVKVLRGFVQLLRDYIPRSAIGNMTVQEALDATELKS